MKAESITNRIRAIRSELNKKTIDCLIVTKPANVTYTTGFLGDDSWVVIIKSRAYLVTDSRYTEQAEKECPNCAIIDRAEPMAEAVAKIIQKNKSIKTIAVESSTSIAEFKQLKKAIGTRIKTADGIIENIRSVKDNSEIKAIKTAGSIAAKALAQTIHFIKPGITESELAGLLDFQIRKLGSTNSFDSIVAFGPNASVAHHKPTLRKLRKNDTVLIDFGAKYKGYCSDITRCFIVGKPTNLYRKVYDALEKAQAAAIKAVKAGITIQKLDAIARDVIRESGLPVYGHGTGHGLGIEIHESPFLKPETKGILEAGHVVTIEPGVYMPGKLGVRVEDDCLVTETGCKILTSKCPHSAGNIEFLPQN